MIKVQLTLSMILNATIIAAVSVAIMVWQKSFSAPVPFNVLTNNFVRSFIPFVVFMGIIGYTKGRILFIHITDEIQLNSVSLLVGISGTYLYNKFEEQNRVNKINIFLMLFEWLIRHFIRDTEMKQRYLNKIIKAENEIEDYDAEEGKK